jgi:SAM-dependent methyltransferase
VVAVNVLEHVPDDLDFVIQAERVLAPGGHLVLFVPAGPGIFGTLDEAFEHYRRYTRGDLARLLERAGFELVELRYSNLPGVLAWWLSGRVLRRRTVTPGSVRLYDRLMVPWLRRLERVWTPPRGQSLFVVGRKRAQPGPA